MKKSSIAGKPHNIEIGLRNVVNFQETQSKWAKRLSKVCFTYITTLKTAWIAFESLSERLSYCRTIKKRKNQLGWLNDVRYFSDNLLCLSPSLQLK
jgi:hypothetical protein